MAGHMLCIKPRITSSLSTAFLPRIIILHNIWDLLWAEPSSTHLLENCTQSAGCGVWQDAKFEASALPESAQNPSSGIPLGPSRYVHGSLIQQTYFISFRIKSTHSARLDLNKFALWSTRNRKSLAERRSRWRHCRCKTGSRSREIRLRTKQSL